ncbi:proline--tRNA ligase [Candidatus Micrarchaeota archaeon]|nr:proline--tRNA ligase [Candidatus Micrarchaeota archaeon]
MIPEEYFKKEGEHIEGFAPEVFWVTEAGGEKLEQRYAMRPTSETAMYSMYSLWIQGKKDLPLKIYQSCQVWRCETKATKPFIRSREFHWIEAHDVFATKEEAEAQVREDMEMAESVIHNVFGVPFMFLRRPQWDKFAGAVDTFAADSLMPDGKALQLPSTHLLRQNFSKPFNVKYMDETGKSEYCWQTCYGPAISRIYAAVIAVHGDSHGLVLPFELAPLQVVVVPIYKDETKETVLNECRKLKDEIYSLGYSVKLDDSTNTPGWKFNHWELHGVPIRLEIGERDLKNNQLTVARRDLPKKEQIMRSELSSYLKTSSSELTKNLLSKADAWFKAMLSEATSMDQLNKILDEKGGFVKVPFCTDSMEGKACAEIVKEKTKGNMRGSRFGDKGKVEGNCIACGKKSSVYLYSARQY